MDLFYLYLSGLIVGGVAVGASLFGGDGDGAGDSLRALAVLRLRLFFSFLPSSLVWPGCWVAY